VSILILLFGQENDPDGKLRAPAAARSAKAAEVWKQLSPGSEVVVLPTGAFGAHFNLADHPHFAYLTGELIRLGVPLENILPGVASSNTVQDATEAWYRFKSGGYNKLVAVTSDYHAARVAFILGRLSANAGAEIEIVTANTPSDYAGKDIELEDQKLETLKREWVDVIPRNSKVAPERFVAVYENAARERRYYGTISLAVVAALFIVDGFAFTIVPGNGGWTLFLMLLLLAIINLLLWSVYNRTADAADTARRVVTRMEIEHRLPGFSSNWWRPDNPEWYRTPPWLWPLKVLATALAVALFATLAIVALAWPDEPERGATPYKAAPISTNSNAMPTPVSSSNGNALDRWANRVMGPDDNSNSNTNTNRRRRR